MSTPKGLKCFPQTAETGDRIFIYSDATQIILQLRRQVPTEEQILEPSFKVAVSLTPGEAVTIASNLLNVALPQLAALRTIAEVGVETALPEEPSEPIIDKNELD